MEAGIAAGCSDCLAPCASKPRNEQAACGLACARGGGGTAAAGGGVAEPVVEPYRTRSWNHFAVANTLQARLEETVALRPEPSAMDELDLMVVKQRRYTLHDTHYLLVPWLVRAIAAHTTITGSPHHYYRSGRCR